MRKDHFCVIMAGGLGSRFWPISRNSNPKQFLDILGTGKTFIQYTFERFAKVIPIENILVVTSKQHESLVMEQLPQLKSENLLLEPYRRNTTACVAYATYKLFKENPNATMVVTPSDHLILNEDIFAETIKSGLEYVSKKNVLLTLGIKPDRAETAYGYIQANKSSALKIGGNIGYNVKTFTEKPNEELAEVFVNSGEFLWNSGIFMWNLKTFKRELEMHQSEIAFLFDDGSKFYNTPQEEEYILRAYEECKSISIDYGIMEKTEKAVVYPASFGWSDIGTWESLYSFHKKDRNENVVRIDEHLLKNVTNSIVISQEKKAFVVEGLDGFMVVNTPDLLVICPRDEAVYKNLFAELLLNGMDKYQ